MKSTTATTEFTCLHPNGDRFAVTIAIGHPYPTLAGDWACPVSIDGLHGRLADIHGGDALQTLCLAIKVVRDRMSSYVASGGRIIEAATGSDVDLDAYFDATRRSTTR